MRGAVVHGGEGTHGRGTRGADLDFAGRELQCSDIAFAIEIERGIGGVRYVVERDEVLVY